MSRELKRFVSRKVYGTTIEANRNGVVLQVVFTSAGPSERRTARWQARPAVSRRRGNVPACTVDAAGLAARPGVVVLYSMGNLRAIRGLVGCASICGAYVT
jgi:hypothetical protein